ncbi:hypothetical protein GQ54DRAFT_70747 [Martensiomyces pterosporus]|nr:hypothetical protein GQ54DRAFT_70747 [Martensiomyces pterosporus]
MFSGSSSPYSLSCCRSLRDSLRDFLAGGMSLALCEDKKSNSDSGRAAKMQRRKTPAGAGASTFCRWRPHSRRRARRSCSYKNFGDPKRRLLIRIMWRMRTRLCVRLCAPATGSYCRPRAGRRWLRLLHVYLNIFLVATIIGKTERHLSYRHLACVDCSMTRRHEPF